MTPLAVYLVKRSNDPLWEEWRASVVVARNPAHARRVLAASLGRRDQKAVAESLVERVSKYTGRRSRAFVLLTDRASA